MVFHRNTVIEGAGYGDALSAKVSGVSKDKIEKEINAGHPLVAVLGKIVYEWTCDEPPLGCRDKRKPPFTQDENGNYVPNPAMYHAVTIAGYTTDGKIIFYDPANGGYFIHNIFSDEYQDDENGYSKGISALITISPPPSPPDSDDDGVPDSQDWCPAEKGDSSNHGCPYSPTVKIDNPADGGKLNIDVTGITCGTVSVTATATDKDSDLDKFEIYFDGGLIPSSKCSFIKDTGGEKKLQCSSDPIARDTTHVIMAKAMDKTNRFSTYAVDVTCHDDISDIFLKIREPKNSEGVYYHSIVFDAQKSKYWSLGNPSVAVDGNPLSSISSTSFSGRELYWSWWNPFDYDIGSSHSIVAKLHRCPLGSSGCGSPTDEKHRDADAISVNVAEPPLDVVFLKSLFGLQGTWLIEAKVIHEAIAEIQAEVASTPTHVATTKVNNNGEFSFYLDTTDFDNGNHTLILKMYDENKNLIGIKTYPMSINNPTIDSIQITSPGNASSLQNNITINASATGTVKEIEIKIDGSRICRQESKTISCIFNTQNLLNGSHVITATAYTPSYTSKSASITVTVSNVKQPGVNLSSPVNGSNVSGIVELSAAVYDWDGNLINNFNDLEYYVDGNVSYKYWDSRIYPHGSSHTVYAVAYDGMGNNVTSKTVTVTVIDLPPKVAFLNLTNGSNVTKMMVIKADISDDRGIKNINLTIDGVEYDYPYLWDPSGVSNGNHTIKIIVTDTGNRTNGTEVWVNVNATKLVIDEGKNITFTMPGDLFAYVSVPMSANVTNASMDLTGLYAYASEINISGGLANDGNYNTYYALGPIDSSHITESEIGQVTSVIVNVYFYITDEDSDDTNYTMQFENVTGEWIIFDSGQWYEGVAYNKSFNLASQYILSGGRYRCQLTIKTDNGDEYLNIYEVEALNAVSYPTNASLDIANNGAIEWNHTGKFNTTVAIADTRNFKETLNLILQNNCSCSSCEIISGRCLIPLKFHSDSTGTLQISNLTLEYNATSSPPAVNITSPADGAVVNNTVIINASASDDTGILKVEFYLDGELICMDVQEPYSCEWNTVNQISGHTIAAVAYDYDGQVGYDVISTVIAGDAPPAVEITNPAPGLVNGTVSIQAIVTDDIGIGRVEVLVDGSEICYSLPCFWNTLEDANGTHNVTVIVYDTAMQSSNDTVIVTLIDTPPAVEILNPLGGLTLNNTVTVNVSAGDDRGVDRVEFYVDGNLSQITASAYLFDWDTNEVGNGEHTLRAVAYDELNQTTENVTTVNVNNDAFPFVNITNPVEGSVVREVINLNANVTDDIGIDRVQWYAKGNITVCDETNASNCTNVNERLLCNLTVGGAAENISVCSLNTSILEDWNVCEIEIIVNDTSGHVSKDRVYVFVINDKPPKVNITSHSDGDYVWGNTTFNATYYDDINVTGIEWFVDDGLVCNASPCVFDFEDEKVSPGEHYVRAVVYDTRGEYGLDVAGVFNCYKIINISSNISGVLADNESICVYDNETCECQIGINLVRVKNNNIPVSDIPVNFSVNDPDFNGVTAEAGNITVSGTNRGYAMIHFPDQAVAHKVGNKILYIPVVSGSNKVCVDADTTSKADIEYRLNHNCDGGEWVYNPPKVTINSINYYKITSSETSEVSGTGGGEGELPPPHPVPDLNPIEFLILFTSAFLLFASLVREREPGKLA
jgi:hypothetical protein